MINKEDERIRKFKNKQELNEVNKQIEAKEEDAKREIHL
jgi:hypothetical protein